MRDRPSCKQIAGGQRERERERERKTENGISIGDDDDKKKKKKKKKKTKKKKGGAGGRNRILIRGPCEFEGGGKEIILTSNAPGVLSLQYAVLLKSAF